MAIPVEIFRLDPNAQGTLQTQIQQLVAAGILDGRFHKGEKLPSSRKLAAHLGVSRITVTLAYTELLSNDYLTSRGRSGYFVSENAPEPPPFARQEPEESRVDWNAALAHRYSGGDTPVKPQNWASLPYPFIYGQTDPRLFDHANWRACALRALGQRDFTALTTDYYDQDDPQLVEFIARHTLPRRGIEAAPEQILVTLGAQNALWLTAQLLLKSGRAVATENPCYHALRDILRGSGARVHPVDIDGAGLPPEAIPHDTDAIYVTPSHQSPTSATMPTQRRQVLLNRAADLNAVIVEDDYEFEMAFLGAPSPALKSLDRDGRVIYVGSFSKSVFPGLRLGYLVGPEPFIREARALRASMLRHPPGHIQRTTAYFLGLGHYDAQIRRMSRALETRRDVMQSAIDAAGLEIAGKGVHGGSSFWMRAPEGIDTADLAARLIDTGVVIEPGAPFFDGAERPRNFYRLAYSSIASERIPEGIARISAALDLMVRPAV